MDPNHTGQTGAPPPPGYPNAQPAGYPPQQPQPYYYPQQPGHPPQQTYPPPQPYTQANYPQQGPPNNPYQAPHIPAPQESTLVSNLGKPIGFDPESQANVAFAERKVRMGFIRKVFFILSLQLAVTVAFAVTCFKTAAIKDYVRANSWPFWLAWALALVTVLILSFSTRARRTHPYNLLTLGLFTVAQSFLVGMVTTHYDSRVVLLAFIVTACTVTAVTIFAIQTKWDVTSKGGILFVLLIVLLILTLVGIFWVNTIFHLVIAGFGALLFTAYLMYDIQLIMGNKQHKLSPDEYVFAALTLYIDIINIFQYVMAIIGIATRN